MRIGQFRHRMAIQTYTDIPSGEYAITPTWVTVGDSFASLEPVKGVTYFDTKQIGEGVTHKVVMRYNPLLPVTSEHWLLYGGRRFRVRNVRDLFERERFIELMCEEEQTL